MNIDMTGVLRLRSLLRAGAIAALTVPAAVLAALPAQSWNGYHWARTGPLAIQLGGNVNADWLPYVSTATGQWNAATNIDFVAVAGVSAPATCNAAYGTVQVCNGSYGRNGWLGLATVWTSGTTIVQATVKLNDSYFVSGSYNTAAWRSMVACQEIGHTLGLAHNDTIRTDLNKGTCMDYTNDPTGTKGGVNGTLANTAPAASDFAALDVIYANLDATQLAQTRPGFRTTDGFAVGEDIDSTAQAIPEPASWALFVTGFGVVGVSQRRRTRRAIVAA